MYSEQAWKMGILNVVDFEFREPLNFTIDKAYVDL